MTTVSGTTPYPWPWHGRLDPMRLALLAVACPDPAGPAEVVETLARHVRRAGGLVVSVRVRPPHRKDGPPADERRAESEEEGTSAGEDRDHAGRPASATMSTEAPLQPDHVVRAAGWDGFHGSDLDGVLRAAGRDLLLLAGCCLELGVHSTMRAANDRGYECLLVADACAAASPDLRQGALSTIEMSGGIFGAVGSRTAVMERL